MIRYLKQEEKTAARPLWEEVFTEDSSSFVDFYYTDKIRHNRILVSEEDGQVVSMIHRNPYDVLVKDRVWKADYIAGVATKKEWRRRGQMAVLMKRCLSDMYAQQMEFCFLNPVDPAIYEPFGFAYIYDFQTVGIEESTEPLTIRACVGASGDYEEAARFAQKELSARYEVHCLRSESYYSALAKEVRSDGGDLMFLQNRERQLSAISAFYGNGSSAMREFICLAGMERKVGVPKPRMMGRITCLEKFVNVIRLKRQCGISQLELIIRVTDGVIRQNDGLFSWKLTEEGSAITRTEPAAGTQPGITIGIGALTAWLFGYHKPAFDEDIKAMTDSIEVLQGVFLDEIV